LNESSNTLKAAFGKYDIEYQLILPAEQTVNISERGIQTLKIHLLAIFCTVDSQFPMAEWARLLPHAAMTLNLLHP